MYFTRDETGEFIIKATVGNITCVHRLETKNNEEALFLLNYAVQVISKENKIEGYGIKKLIITYDKELIPENYKERM